MYKDSCVPVVVNAIRVLMNSGKTARQSAFIVMQRMPTSCEETIDRIGCYPSSEPELRALQIVMGVL